MIPIRWLTLLSVCTLITWTTAAEQVEGQTTGRTAGQDPVFSIELESALAWQSYNDVEIPNDGSATRFSLYDLAGSGPWLANRLYVTWNPAHRHRLRLLVAPFSLSESAVPDSEISFAGADYAAGQLTEATYTFNSYRLSYRYLFHDSDRTRAWIGFTGKIRDAVIRLDQNDVGSRKTDLGFVPLLHVAGEFSIDSRWHVSLDADALAGGPGRAADAALKLGYNIHERWNIQTGYRTVEGGADVDEVYTFAWLHYALLSLSWGR